jgi:hypothetical protein
LFTSANIQKVFGFADACTFFYVLFLKVIKKTLSLQHTGTEQPEKEKLKIK